MFIHKYIYNLNIEIYVLIYVHICVHINIYVQIIFHNRLLQDIEYEKKKDMEYGSLCYTVGLPRWLSGEESACSAVDPCSVSGLGRSPGRQPTPVFLPGESHGQRSLAGYSPWGCRELDTTEVT